MRVSVAASRVGFKARPSLRVVNLKHRAWLFSEILQERFQWSAYV